MLVGVGCRRLRTGTAVLPARLVDDLLADRPRRVLDLGSGTGKPARLFHERGLQVLGVEPDAAMAAVAARHGIAVEVATFEEWQPRARIFELVACGQAWHWVDPTAGVAQLARVLRFGGRFAAFWNREQLAPAVRAALDAAYAEAAPPLVGGGLGSDPADHLRLLTASGCFQAPTTTDYRWRHEYPTQAWLDLMLTHSNHRLADAATLARLGAAVTATLAPFRGVIAVEYVTTLVSVRAASAD